MTRSTTADLGDEGPPRADAVLPHESKSIEALLGLTRVLLLTHADLGAADRDDVAQDVALVVLRRWPSYRSELGPVDAWLRGIVRIELLAWRRRRGRVVGDVVSELPEVSVENDVEATIAAHERLAGVPAAARRVLELCATGYTFREVAVREGISASTALARHGRALAALAQIEEAARAPEQRRGAP
jgi:DNA-directed RNA polymerase specialized sigma24 family protein